MFLLSREIDATFNYMTASEIFLEGRFRAWKSFLIQRLGGYSVIRGSVDRDAFRTTRQLLQAGERPSVIFAEGILWGAKVSDKYGVDASGALLTDGTGGGLPRIRVNGSMYNTGLKAGKVLRDASGNILKTGYSENYREQQIWRVRKNWNTADLAGDIAIIKNIEAKDVTEAQIAAGKSQYEHDWNEWPADEGAPYDDVNGDGAYTAATWDAENSAWVGDIPGIPGADQTIWTVANDLPDEFTGGAPVSVSEGGLGLSSNWI